MKNNLFLFLIIFSSSLFGQDCCISKSDNPSLFCSPLEFDLAISSGYVWKNDKRFRQVYGNGIIDIATVDFCAGFQKCMGLGLKGSYWAAQGKTIACKKKTNVYEVPLILYLRGKIGSIFQAYVSLGGGVLFTKEKSYLGTVNQTVWGGEAEIGLNYYFYKNFFITSAFRYLYFEKNIPSIDDDADFGGYGIRAGLGFTF